MSVWCHLPLPNTCPGKQNSRRCFGVRFTLHGLSRLILRYPAKLAVAEACFAMIVGMQSPPFDSVVDNLTWPALCPWPFQRPCSMWTRASLHQHLCLTTCMFFCCGYSKYCMLDGNYLHTVTATACIRVFGLLPPPPGPRTFPPPPFLALLPLPATQPLPLFDG